LIAFCFDTKIDAAPILKGIENQQKKENKINIINTYTYLESTPSKRKQNLEIKHWVP